MALSLAAVLSALIFRQDPQPATAVGTSFCSTSSVCGLALIEQGSTETSALCHENFVGTVELPAEQKQLHVWTQSWLGCRRGFADPFFFFFVKKKALCLLSFSSHLPLLNIAQIPPSPTLTSFLLPIWPAQEEGKNQVSEHFSFFLFPHRQVVGRAGRQFRCVWTALGPYIWTGGPSVCISLYSYISSSVCAQHYLK